MVLRLVCFAEALWGRFEDKRVGPGRIRLEDPVRTIMHLRVDRQFRQITTDQGEMMFGVQAAYLPNAVQRCFIAYMAPQRIG